MAVLSTTVIAVDALFATATAAWAQTAPPRQQSFKSLMSQGYDIKAVTAVTSHLQGGDESREVIVTLQKARSVGVCAFRAYAWQGLDDPPPSDPSRCQTH